MIFYESPKRLKDSLLDIEKEMGHDRIITISKELTKKWEYICTGKIKKIRQKISQDTHWKKGEIVILIDGTNKNQKINSKKILEIYNLLKKNLTHKQSIQIISKIYGIKKNSLYNKLMKKDF